MERRADSDELAPPPPPPPKPAPAEDGARYRGVWMRKWGKWVAEVRLPNSRKRIWLGSYTTAAEAARAYDAASLCLRGPAARFNFPDDPPDIPNATALSRDQILEAAVSFARSKREAAVRTTDEGAVVSAMETNNSNREGSTSFTLSDRGGAADDNAKDEAMAKTGDAGGMGSTSLQAFDSFEVMIPEVPWINDDDDCGALSPLWKLD